MVPPNVQSFAEKSLITASQLTLIQKRSQNHHRSDSEKMNWS